METFLKHLRENWVIWLFLGSVLMSWAVFSSRLAQAEKDILDLQTTLSKINQIQIDLAVIKEHISNIDKKIQ